MEKIAPKKECISCASPMDGLYCKHCGEKKVNPENDFAVSRFVKQFFFTFTDIDNIVLRSFKYLLLKPGFLSTEYLLGRRKIYIRPIRLFLIINVFYFLFAGFTGMHTLSTRLSSHMIHDNFFHKEIAKKWVNETLEKKEIDYPNYEKAFNQVIDRHSKTLIVIMVPLFALLSWLLYWRTPHFFVEHLVFSTHFFTWLLLMQMLFFPSLYYLVKLIIYLSGAEWPRFFLTEAGTSLAISLAILSFMYLGLKWLFQQSVWWTAIKSLALFFGLYYLVLSYRALLFFIAFYTL